MKARIELILRGETRSLEINLDDYSYAMCVGEVESRFHSAMQRKRFPTSYFDGSMWDTLLCPKPHWVFKELYSAGDYGIKKITLAGDSGTSWEGYGTKTYDHYPNHSTPLFNRKKYVPKTQTQEMDLDDDRK